jgi:hypothetical protein
MIFDVALDELLERRHGGGDDGFVEWVRRWAAVRFPILEQDVVFFRLGAGGVQSDFRPFSDEAPRRLPADGTPPEKQLPAARLYPKSQAGHSPVRPTNPLSPASLELTFDGVHAPATSSATVRGLPGIFLQLR